MIKPISIFVLSVALTWGLLAQAHRPHVSHKEVKAWGFKPVQQAPRISKASGKLKIPYDAFSLSFPTPLLDENPLGSIMHQIQDYTKPYYYHAGIDIRTQMHETVRTPISGKIEAGYYSYQDEEDGSTTKFFLTYEDVLNGNGAPPWGKRYFELAVIDENGYRFEFHHVDPDLLSEQIVHKILSHGTVQKGEEIGKIVRWSGKNEGLEYHHLHYNIISPEGILVNPLYVSEKLNDVTPPIITFVYSARDEKCKGTVTILDRIENEKETHGFIVVETRDYNMGRRYSNPPARLKATFGNKVWEWDFTQTLTHPLTGGLPDLRDYYLKSYCIGNNIETPGSRSYHFYLKVPVPSFYNGPVLIESFDLYGNSTSKTVNVKTPSI